MKALLCCQDMVLLSDQSTLLICWQALCVYPTCSGHTNEPSNQMVTQIFETNVVVNLNEWLIMDFHTSLLRVQQRFVSKVYCGILLNRKLLKSFFGGYHGHLCWPGWLVSYYGLKPECLGNKSMTYLLILSSWQTISQYIELTS